MDEVPDLRRGVDSTTIQALDEFVEGRSEFYLSRL